MKDLAVQLRRLLTEAKTITYGQLEKKPNWEMDEKLAEEGDIPRAVLIVEGKLTKDWAVGVKKWWREWVKQAKNTRKLVGKKDAPTKKNLEAAIEFVGEGIDRIRRIRDDLYNRRGLFPFALSGNKKHDIVRGKDKTIAALHSNLRNETAYITEEAIKALKYAQDHLEHTFGVCTDEEMARRMANPWPPIRIYGGKGNLTAWESSVLYVIPEQVDAADKVLEKLFKKIREFAKKYEAEMGSPREEPDNVTEFTVHGMKAVAVQPEPSIANLKAGDRVRAPSAITSGAKTMKYAYQLLKRAGFDGVWYGTVFLYPESDRYEFTGDKSGKSYKATGNYSAAGDVVRIMYNPHEMGEILIHELGHRYYYRCMRPAERAAFNDWFERVKPVTSYGGENPAEDFAEVFSAYVLGGKYRGRKMDHNQVERFLTFAKPGGKARRCRR